MIIKAKRNFNGILDLSSLERIREDNHLEAYPFRLTIKPGQLIEVDDKWYTLTNIQNSLKAEYIEILDYKQQNVFSQEVLTPESSTPNFNLTKVEILNRADYPEDAFRKYNSNLDIIDANLGSGGGAHDNTKANVSGQIFTGDIGAPHVNTASIISTGDITLSPSGGDVKIEGSLTTLGINIGIHSGYTHSNKVVISDSTTGQQIELYLNNGILTENAYTGYTHPNTVVIGDAMTGQQIELHLRGGILTDS